MPATPIYVLPYPAASDPADVPLDMQELASRIEVVIGPGTANGQVPVWDNSTKKWVAGSVSGALSATPPASPFEGQLWSMSPAAGVVWTYRYNAAGATYKWEFVGGPPIALSGSAQFATMNSILAWRVLPAVTIPVARSGEYHVWGGTRLTAPPAGQRQLSASVVKVAGSGPGPVGVQASALVAQSLSVNFALPEQLFTAVAANDSFTLGVSDNGLDDSNAFFLIAALRPVRVS